LRQSIEKDNKSYLVDSQLFNQDFFMMIKKILLGTGQLIPTQYQYPLDYLDNFVKVK